MNNKGAGQISQTGRLICTFVVCIWHKQVFSWRGSYHMPILGLKPSCSSGMHSAISIQAPENNYGTLKSEKLGHMKNCCNNPQIWTMRFYHRIMHPKDTDGIMTNSIDLISCVYTVCPELSVQKLRITMVTWDLLPVTLYLVVSKSSLWS